MKKVLFNPYSNNGKGILAQKKLKELFASEELDFIDVTKYDNIGNLCKSFAPEDEIILAGGDGTLTHFVNDVYELKLPNKMFLYFCGSGNDFMNDVREFQSAEDLERRIIPINQYMKSLPKVYVNGMTKYFINGIGFGIDGFCCEEGDKVRATSDRKVNYTLIALKGLLGKYKTRNATVTIDGVSRTYKRVWLAPAMLGRFYGGGMMIAPAQDRLNKEKLITSAVCYGVSAFRIITIFFTIFKGEHVKYDKIIHIEKGHSITVEFDKPCALQIDGETVLNVTKYTAEYN